jgi:hypothetical protein
VLFRSKEEVIAALFDNAVRCQYRDIRIDGDEVVVEFVNPATDDTIADSTGDDEQHRAEDSRQPAAPEPDKPHLEKIGPNEAEITDLIEQGVFRAFLSAANREQAKAIVLEKTNASSFSQFDREKYKRANLRDLIGEYQAWLMGE